jgi:hypothetical protein
MKTISAKTSFIALFALAVSLSACQKPNGDNAKATTSNLAGTYKITAMKGESDNGTESDLYPTLDDCTKNSTQILRSDMSYEEVDTCSSSHSSTWGMVSSNMIIIDGAAFDLVSFDGHNLVIAFTLEVGDQKGKIKETLTKQ